jgi:heat shock protein HtpX
MQTGESAIPPSAGENTPAYARTVARQAIVTAMLIVGFYLLTAVAIVGLFALTLFFMSLGFYGLFPAMFSFAGGLIMLIAVLPRYRRFKVPGPRIGAEGQPGLFEVISEVAAATKQPVPHEVYLVSEINAWVTERGGIFGFGKRRVLGIGLPVLAILSVSELRAVLAHEFGHYYGGDTRAGPWVYKAHNAMLAMAEGLGQSGYGAWINVLLVPYVELFLHITFQISRYQELAADRLSVRVAGSGAAASALKMLDVTDDLLEAYWDSSVLPLAGAGYLPPIMEGFSRYVRVGLISASMSRKAEVKVQDSRDNRFAQYSTHPSLAQRLEAFAGQAGPEVAGDGTPAFTLVRDHARLEREMLTKVIGKKRVEKLKQVDWDDICMQVYYPTWVESVRADARGLSGVTPEALPEIVKNLGVFSVRLLEKSQRRWGSDDDARWNERVSATIGAALSLALHQAGWTLHAAPGEPVRGTRGGEEILPFEVLGKLVSRRLAADDWREQCLRAGIAGVDFGDLGVAGVVE